MSKKTIVHSTMASEMKLPELINNFGEAWQDAHERSHHTPRYKDMTRHYCYILEEELAKRNGDLIRLFLKPYLEKELKKIKKMSFDDYCKELHKANAANKAFEGRKNMKLAFLATLSAVRYEMLLEMDDCFPEDENAAAACPDTIFGHFMETLMDESWSQLD